MSLSQSPVAKSDALSSALSHIHVGGESCPTCDQPIPLDRFEETKEKIGTRQAAQATLIATRLQEQFKREKADALEEAGREAAATLATKVATARAEERQAANAVASQKLAEAARLSKEAQAALQVRIDQAEAAKIATEQSGNALRAELEQSRLKHEAAIEQMRREAEANAATIRAEAAKEAQAAMQGKIEGMERARREADILHTVIHNGIECGSIICDSKNHNAWRNEFVTKLATDQMAAKAEHAVLSTRKFPAGKRHLHVQDGVILAAPSRVIALVQILREHLVQTHTLRCSNEARTQKTAALYAFINSERCRDLFARIDTQAEKLLELQVKEKKAHELNWKTQGELIRSVQKVQAEIINEIDSIVGTAERLEQAVHE